MLSLDSETDKKKGLHRKGFIESRGEYEMASFFSEILDEFLTGNFLMEVRKKYHYGETQVFEFQAVAEEMLPLVRAEAFWARKRYCFENRKRTKQSDTRYEKVVMSLGNGVDHLQENYMERGLLSESYMVEVLASELLLQGYAAYNNFIQKNTGWHVARYHFFGSEDEFPLTMLPKLLKEWSQQIQCNAAFYMQPQKSAAFIAELTQKEVQCEGICAGCQSSSCPGRKMSIHVTNKKQKAAQIPPIECS